uniref:DUF2493 domain-containing protein n=1 Tax=viral metagenome TaxID=1070528 RepID=A0A6C0KRA8_9ZZZZ
MTSIEEDVLFQPNVIVLGIFGSNNKIKEMELQDNILTVMLQELKQVPDKILLPSEGNSSMYIHAWAEALHIPTQVFQSDWARNGKIAQIIRDDRIQKECTHAFVFPSQRSSRLEKYSEKMAKKGKMVFTADLHNQLLHLEVCPSAPSLPASARARKSSKGTGQTLLKFQKKEEC